MAFSTQGVETAIRLRHHVNEVASGMRDVLLQGTNMDRYRKGTTLAVRAVEAVFGATRIFGDKDFMLGLIETIKVMIAAFVALQTIDLILSAKQAEDDH